MRSEIEKRLISTAENYAQPMPGQSGCYVVSMWVVSAVIREAVAAGAALASQPQAQPSFQASVGAWMRECFAPAVCTDATERGDRFLEEVLELLQSHGYDRGRVPTLVEYVYGRPVGEPAQEVGGVMVTLAAYCATAGLDMHAEGARELARITQPEVMAKIRRKQAAKNALHFDTPLPGSEAQPAAPQDVDLGQFREAIERLYELSEMDNHHGWISESARLLKVIDSQHQQQGDARPCYACGERADSHPWETQPGGGKKRGACPAEQHQQQESGA